MPSRPTLAAIAAFWLATCGFVLYRDVWPRLAATGPPAMTVDLGEEATPNTPVRWSLHRGDKRVGRLNTHTGYADADGTIQQTHDYQQLEFEFGGARVVVPRLILTTRVSRAGDLREQTADGRFEVHLGKDKFEADAHVHGRVIDGAFVGRCKVRSSLGDVDEELEPVPVPAGQALNPLQVTSRITGLKPGQRWVVQEIDPLAEAVAALVKRQLQKVGFPAPERKREPIVARVSSAPEVLTWKGAEERCWVIEYRGGEARAKTWVRASDGKVLRQEAYGMGERLTVEREE